MRRWWNNVGAFHQPGKRRLRSRLAKGDCFNLVFLAQQFWTRARIAEALRRKVETETGERLRAVQDLDQWLWQQTVYQQAFEQALAVVRPSLVERDLLGVWN